MKYVKAKSFAETAGVLPQLEVLIRSDIKSWRRPGLGWWKKTFSIFKNESQKM